MSSTSTEATYRNQTLTCANCLTSGAVTWEETSAPYARARTRLRKLVGLTAGFKSIDNGERDGPEITCSGCGARISPR